MKIDTRGIARVLHAPGDWRVILFYGDDTGLVRERAALCVRAVASTLDDPFRVAVLDRDAPANIEEEAGALSLVGGRRVVWVRDAGDSLAPPLKRILDGKADALIVIEAQSLAARSKLRSLCEAEKQVACVACYPEEGRALSDSIVQMLAVRKVKIDSDAVSWLGQRLSADRAATRSEVEKLALYAGEGGHLTLHDVNLCIADAASASLEDAAFFATCGERQSADLAIERSLSEGISPIAVARALLSHLHRLRRVRLATEGGQSRADAIKTLRPPVFFKRSDAFSRALSLWDSASLMEATTQVQAFEFACKQTGAPDLVLCRRLIAEICARARAKR